jgi:tRNA-2-methylthio-N6-dimethylallyladenosine synthase
VTVPPTTKGSVYVETYGCQMNVSDSELMLGRLAADGYAEAATPEEADVILLNTCAIRDHEWDLRCWNALVM